MATQAIPTRVDFKAQTSSMDLGLTPIQLQEKYLKLIFAHASFLYERLPPTFDQRELYGSGFKGLKDASERYDATRGLPFRIYAFTRIRGEMLDYLRDLDCLTRGHRAEVKDTDLARAMEAPLVEDSKGIGIVKDNHKAKGWVTDQQGVYNQAYFTIQYFADTMPNPEIAASENEVRNLLSTAIQQIADDPRRTRWAMALRLYFYEGLTEKNVGIALGVNESRISQMLKQALIALRKILVAKVGMIESIDPDRRVPFSPRTRTPLTPPLATPKRAGLHGPRRLQVVQLAGRKKKGVYPPPFGR